MSFGEALIAAREAAGVKLADAARVAGASYVTLYRWEKGIRVPRYFRPVAVYLEAIGAKKRDVVAVERAYHDAHREPAAPTEAA